MSFGTFIFSVKKKFIPFFKMSYASKLELTLKLFGRISVSSQNMSAFLIDPSVKCEALVRAWQILLDSG